MECSWTTIAAARRYTERSTPSALSPVRSAIRALSARTDSSLRVAVRLERLRLHATLSGLRTFSAEARSRIEKVTADVAALERSVQIVGRLDEVERRLAELRHATSGAPPTRIGAADRALREATRLLAKPSLTNAEMQAAEAFVQTAGARVETIMQPEPEFSKTLAERVKELRKRFDPGASSARRRSARQSGPSFPTCSACSRTRRMKIRPPSTPASSTGSIPLSKSCSCCTLCHPLR